MRLILGLSAYYHDSAAALLRDGAIVAAAQEERFSRRKNDERFPAHAVAFCLRHAQIQPDALDAVVFYDKPITKFTRMLETYLAIAPGGLSTFPEVLPGWLAEKLDLRRTIREEVPGLRPDCPILFTEHHQAHAASAFFPGPFDEAAILTVDGVGEWATTTIGRGRGDQMELLLELHFPHSLGLLYSAFTAYCGFRVNSGEYKLMGLAPYGKPRFADAIRHELLDLKQDGSFWLNLDYFDFLRGRTMTNDRFHRLFGGPPRPPEGALEARHLDVASSIQAVTNEVMLGLARQAREVTSLPRLCLAGGVALNCVANGLILREKIFDAIWIQPAAGDAGGALGAALAVWHGQRTSSSAHSPEDASGSPSSPHEERVGRGPRRGEANHDEPPLPSPLLHPMEEREKTSRSMRFDRSRAAPPADRMQGAFLGPGFSNEEIEAVLQAHRAVYERLPEDALLDRTVDLLRQEKVIGWFQGRMEYGPRALGNRSILGDPRSPRMQSVMNLKVKFRESFRPFAPAVLRSRVADYFELEADSPYMLLVAPLKESLRRPVAEADGLDRLKQLRSTIPAVTHVDYSARVQTVEPGQNPRFYSLLERFERSTGCAVLVNTSFNVRGEPVVCTPDDAYRCFINTEMDHLVIGDFVLERAAQPQKQVTRTFEPVAD